MQSPGGTTPSEVETPNPRLPFSFKIKKMLLPPEASPLASEFPILINYAMAREHEIPVVRTPRKNTPSYDASFLIYALRISLMGGMVFMAALFLYSRRAFHRFFDTEFLAGCRNESPHANQNQPFSGVRSMSMFCSR